MKYVVLFAFVLLLITGCGSSSDYDESQSKTTTKKPEKPSPYPRIDEAKSLIDEGYELYTQALNIDDQYERDRILNSVLEKYSKAERILNQLAAEYEISEYPKIGELQSLLVMRKKDANFSKGLTDK
jgi:ABC-type Fe3+-hydroxamate transport system substrate-binding protein